MDNSSLQRVRELIDTGKSFGIAVGAQAGMDEMGAALALYLSLTYANKQVSIVSAVEPTVAVSSLVGIDKVKSSFEGGGVSGDLIVSFPYREGEIEKVSYTIDNGYLNIVVKAGERGLAFDERDVVFKRGATGGSGAPEVLFIIGTPRLSDLGNLFNPELLRDTRVVNIDYRTDNQGFGDVVLVAPKFSSVSEQVADMLSGLSLEIDVDVAQNLFDGIAYATENFQSPRTSSLAFEISGLLMRKGAIRTQQPVRPQPDIRAQLPTMPQPQPRSTMPQQPSFRQQPPAPQQAPQMPSMPQPQQQAPQMPQRPQSGFGQAPQYGQQSYQQPPMPQPSFRQQPPAPQQAPQMPSMPQPQEQPQPQNQQQDDAPSDWLTPKVYKGSTAV